MYAAADQQRAQPVPPPPLPMDRMATQSAYPTPGPGPMRPNEHLIPVTTHHDQCVWALDVAQQPIRARMCGFGDKDRRPITPPPCVRLIVTEEGTGKEVQIKYDTSFFQAL